MWIKEENSSGNKNVALGLQVPKWTTTQSIVGKQQVCARSKLPYIKQQSLSSCPSVILDATPPLVRRGFTISKGFGLFEKVKRGSKLGHAGCCDLRTESTRPRGVKATKINSNCSRFIQHHGELTDCALSKIKPLCKMQIESPALTFAALDKTNRIVLLLKLFEFFLLLHERSGNVNELPCEMPLSVTSGLCIATE